MNFGPSSMNDASRSVEVEPQVTRRRYVIACSAESSLPARAIGALQGTHIWPPDSAVVPPNWGEASKTTTDNPRSAAAQAATRPAPPEPTTTTSKDAVEPSVLGPVAPSGASGSVVLLLTTRDPLSALAVTTVILLEIL